jgi:hypothetical protein
MTSVYNDIWPKDERVSESISFASNYFITIYTFLSLLTKNEMFKIKIEKGTYIYNLHVYISLFTCCLHFTFYTFD